MNRKRILSISLALFSLILLYFIFFSGSDEEVAIIVKVKKGEFLNEVVISGEAQSTSLKKIDGPASMRKHRLNSVKIQNLIPEGTIIKKGDYVGSLDPSEINDKILDAQLDLESAQSKYTQEQLDTTLTLKQERTVIKDLEFTLAEDKLELERSVYEPPSTIKQLEIKIERANRDLKEKREDYNIIRSKAIAKMVEVGTEVSKTKNLLAELTELQKSFIINSDATGMVTYAKNWDGTKRKVGSTISPWDRTIATLPDLTKMESKTYANEVDIRKIKKDQKVSIGFDAFPNLIIDGVVTNVANVGEKKRGSDLNLFQVQIKFNETDESIRPGMTTSNKIVIGKKDDVLLIPIEAVFSQDSLTYVYTKSGFSVEKKEVELGVSNLDEVIVKRGLLENETVYLNTPQGLEDKKVKRLK